MEKQTLKPFGAELEERCLKFALDVARFCRSLKKDYILLEYCIQLIRAASSVGANYIEANESLSRKDFLNRAKICRKEAKESRYWLRLINPSLSDKTQLDECNRLIQEAKELMLIFNSMVNKQKVF